MQLSTKVDKQANRYLQDSINAGQSEKPSTRYQTSQAVIDTIVVPGKYSVRDKRASVLSLIKIIQ
jgi:hypothetical protein